MKYETCQLCIIGGGSGGLSLAAGAAQLGVKVILIERDQMGGDCLNSGCVPSKSLIAAARVAESRKHGKDFGIAPTTPKVNMRQVQSHVAKVIASIAPHDSVERFKSLGVNVIKGSGSFIDEQTIQVKNKRGQTVARISFDKAVIASGSRPAIPPIEGLIDAKPLTNETIFQVKSLPKHMLVIGGGPIGCELAQSWCRLGAKVTLLEALPRILPRDDAEAAQIVKQQLLDDGLQILEQVAIQQVKKVGQSFHITLTHNNKKQTLKGDALLVATGRRPNIEDLSCEKAAISYGPKGILTDDRLRTSNRRVYAIGDVNQRSLAFTHVAGYQASLLVRSLLFKLRSRYQNKAIPWCTYTDPECAHVGLDEESARKTLGTNLRVLHLDWHLTDRGRAERIGKSMIKVCADKKGYVHGATLVGPHAGEHVLIWTMMIDQKIKLSKLASLIAPYPTLSEGHKHIAGQFYREALFSNKTKRAIRWLRHLPW